MTGGEAFEIAGARRGLVKPTTGRGGIHFRRPRRLRRGANEAGEPAVAGAERPEPVS